MKPEAVVKYFQNINDSLKASCSSRHSGIQKFMLDNANNISRAPFSRHKDGPCCFPGGLLVHTAHTMKVAEEMRENYFKHISADSTAFCSFFHGMWRIGDDESVLYEEQTDQYWNKTRGFLYKENEEIRFFAQSDRILYMMSKYNIPATKDEWLAIRNYAGAFHKGNYNYVGHFSELETLIQMSVQLSTVIEVRNYKTIERKAEQKVLRADR